MTDKNLVKDFVTALANDDYVKADEVFPKVVQSSLDKIINSKKEEVVTQLNKDAERIAGLSIEPEVKAPEGDKKENGV